VSRDQSRSNLICVSPVARCRVAGFCCYV
jgi:hypothetical protein